MRNRFEDFDKFEAEAAAKPLEIKWGGKKYELPGEMSAAQMGRVQRIRAAVLELQEAAERDPDHELSEEETEQIRAAASFNVEAEAREAFGDEIVDEWLDAGMGHKTLRRIFSWALQLYEGADGEEAESEGEVEAPQRAPRKKTTSRRSGSSTTGRRSKPTSTASTESS